MADLPSKPVGVTLVATFPPDGRFEYGLSFHVVNDLTPDLPSQSRNAGDRYLPPGTPSLVSLLSATEIRFIQLSPADR